MAAIKTAPFGTWKSAVTADQIAGETVGLDMITTDGADLYWLEIRPNENGRGVIVRRCADGRASDVTPAGFHVGSRLHEYGGGAYVVDNGTIYFANFADQRIYKHDLKTNPVPLTPAPTAASQLRFGDLIVDRAGQRLIAVCEEYPSNGSQPVNSLVAISTDGIRDMVTIARGRDFYSSPRLSQDGSQLAWLSWDHPNMPWDGTSLNVAQSHPDGTFSEAVVIAGGAAESIFQPEWSNNGDLIFVSDRNNWWNLYRYRDAEIEALLPLEAEFARAQWVFGLNTYAIETDHSLICTYNRGALWKLARLDLETKRVNEIPNEYTDIWWPKTAGDKVFFRGASPAKTAAIVALDLKTGECKELKSSSSLKLDENLVSKPEIIEFPADDGQCGHALFYAPRNNEFAGTGQEQPPLIVKCHGGPTGTLSSALNLEIQFWTSRGFAVVDVNYGGSTGYGRRYRERLDGQWGIVDVSDCSNAAAYLVKKDCVDSRRILISGRSASGFTALCALTFKDIFRGGASYYGISDLIALTSDTHKFELHILDKLVAPYPEGEHIYRARSPINHVDRINCPIVFFQGLEDKVVPPSQTKSMVAALENRRIPVACLMLKDERHGFRKAENIKLVLESELSFYSQILGFEAADRIPPIAIKNLDSPVASH